MVMKIQRESLVAPQKDTLLDSVSSDIQMPHLLASLEYAIDLMMDMQFKIMDALISDEKITLTEAEKETYLKLKGAQSVIKSFDLEKSKFPDEVSVVDYMYHFKQAILQKRMEYFQIKQKFNMD